MRAAVLVLADQLVLQKLFHSFIRIAADISQRDAVILGGNVPLDVLAKNVDEYVRAATR